MRSLEHPALVWATIGSLLVSATGGCHMREKSTFKPSCGDDCYTAIATQVEYPQVDQCSAIDDGWAAAAPVTLSTTTDIEYWDLSLQEVVQIALAQSRVIRDLGGAVLRTPAAIETHWDPAVVDTDPRFGYDAALSAFDAQLSASVFGEKNDRALNNEFFGGGTRLLDQDLIVAQTQISKKAATGSQFAFRHYMDYDSNNAPGNIFSSAYNTNFETEMRQPLLQGAGSTFNRIAGSSNIPGLYNGVLIARANTDVELADFEIAVRDLVSNLENAYWDLYFAYRDLDAKAAARDASLETWRRINALYKAGRRGGEAEKEAQAREQFYRFQEDVQNALSGRLVDGTSVNNGSSGGTFRAGGGVQVAERRLRMLVGLPPSDGRLIRTSDEPVTAPVHFDWSEITCEALIRRVELRRQRFVTRRYELEWMASKNYLLPKLDAVGRYRWRGFGDDLLHSDSTGRPRFDNAFMDLTSGDFQEWQLGLELNVPIGYRREFAAVRNSELLLARSRAVLKEQEHLVLHDAAGAIAEFDRAMMVAETTSNRLDAARAQLGAVAAAFDADKAPLDLLLEAQRLLGDAESRHFRSLAEYAIAIKNVHYSKGTLLDYDGVQLSEGAWPTKAYSDAARRESSRGRAWPLNYASASAPLVSEGAFDQGGVNLTPVTEDAMLPAEGVATPPAAPGDEPTPIPPPVEAPLAPAEPLPPAPPQSMLPTTPAPDVAGALKGGALVR
ncbi:MAG TPA: TolC family protein [Lacipirellulaceae bacterium]|nr:TolC family protein [Lacipirellulaceae bacterium]